MVNVAAIGGLICGKIDVFNLAAALPLECFPPISHQCALIRLVIAYSPLLVSYMGPLVNENGRGVWSMLAIWHSLNLSS